MLCTHTHGKCAFVHFRTHTHTTGLILSNNNVLNCNDALIFMYIKYFINSSIRPLKHTKEFSESHISVHCSKVVKLFNVHLKKYFLEETHWILMKEKLPWHTAQLFWYTNVFMSECSYMQRLMDSARTMESQAEKAPCMMWHSSGLEGEANYK